MTKKCIFAVSSSSYAMKGTDALASAGIYARVVKLRANEAKNGCAYGISVNCRDREKAAGILLRVGILYSELLS